MLHVGSFRLHPGSLRLWGHRLGLSGLALKEQVLQQQLLGLQALDPAGCIHPAGQQADHLLWKLPVCPLTQHARREWGRTELAEVELLEMNRWGWTVGELNPGCGINWTKCLDLGSCALDLVSEHAGHAGSVLQDTGPGAADHSRVQR